MDLVAYATALRQAAAAVQAAGPRIVELQAQTGRVLAQQRVQERGIANATYSGKLFPSFLLKGKELNAGGKAYIQRNKQGNWAGFRAAQGRQNRFVDLTYSGRTFQSLQVRTSAGSSSVFRAVVVSSDTESAKKLRFNLERYGDFMAPTSAERGQLAVIADREIATVIRQFV